MARHGGGWGDPMTESHDVVVIGAGPAGLAVGDELQRRGLQPLLIDEAGEVGSSWQRRHDQLRLNTHRRYSGQPNRPLPRSVGTFARRDDYIAFLKECAADLADRIRFGVAATSLQRNGSTWHIATTRGELEADQVVIATGSDRVPFIPRWPGVGSYQGELLHAADFGSVERYAGKRVLLVGIGNSAVDVGNYLSEIDLDPSWVSVRHGAHIAPQRIFGIPAHLLLMLIRWLPIRAQDGLIRAFSRLLLGNLQRHGIPAPPGGPVSRFFDDGVTTAVDNGFVKAVKDGRFTVVAEIERFTESTVHLTDGTQLEPDVIICATGYRLGLEPLVGHLDVLDEQGRPRFVADEADPRHPGLWFFGLNSSIYGNMFLRLHETEPLAAAIVSART